MKKTVKNKVARKSRGKAQAGLDVKKTLQISGEKAVVEGVSADQIVEFLENYQDLVNPIHRRPLKLISIKVPQPLLDAFKFKAKQNSIPYQTQIKVLMSDWLKLSHLDTK